MCSSDLALDYETQFFGGHVRRRGEALDNETQFCGGHVRRRGEALDNETQFERMRGKQLISLRLWMDELL